MHEEQAPGYRIRTKRCQIDMTQAELGNKVSLSEGAINRLEVGVMPITQIDDSELDTIAQTLGTTTQYLLHGELHSERATRDELNRLLLDNTIDEAERNLLDEVAMTSIRKRSNANIPLSRRDLLALLEVIRGADGY